MPTTDDTPKDVKIPLPADSGWISSTEYLTKTDADIRVFEVREGMFAASFGASQVVLTVEAWRALIGAVEQVLPVARPDLSAVADAAFEGDEVNA